MRTDRKVKKVRKRVKGKNHIFPNNIHTENKITFISIFNLIS